MKRLLTIFFTGGFLFLALGLNTIHAEQTLIEIDRYTNPNYLKVDTTTPIPWVLRDHNSLPIASDEGIEFDTQKLSELPDGVYHIQTSVEGKRQDLEFELKHPDTTIHLDEGNNPFDITFSGHHDSIFEWEIQHLTSVGTEDHYFGSGTKVPAILFDDIKKVEGTYEIQLKEIVTDYMTTTIYKNFQVIFPKIDVTYDSLTNPTFFRATGQLGRPIIHWQITQNFKIVDSDYGSLIDSDVLNLLNNGTYQLEMYEANRYGSKDVVYFDFVVNNKEEEDIKPPIIEDIKPEQQKPTAPKNPHTQQHDTLHTQQPESVDTGIVQQYKGYILMLVLALIILIAVILYNKSNSKKRK